LSDDAQVFEIKSYQKENAIDKEFANLLESTFEESSFNIDSQFKPFNSDDLYQKTSDYRIYEEMVKDDQIHSLLTLKKDLVLGDGGFFEPGEPGQEDIIDDLKRALFVDPDVEFTDQIEEILSAYEFGFSIAERIFAKRNDGTLTLKAIKTRHPNTWEIHTDKHGNVERYVQKGVASDIEVKS